MHLLSKCWMIKGYKAAAYLIFGLFLLFVMINCAFYLVLRFQSRTVNFVKPDPMTLALTSPLLKQVYPDLTRDQIKELLKETWKARPFSYEPFTQFKEREFKGSYVNVDQNGFRASKNQGVWPPDPGNYNVFLFGGSTTFGYGVPDDQTIASYLQEILQNKMDNDVRVYNFGRGFYYWFQERVLFEKLLTSGYAPDMAIFIDGYNGSIFNTCNELFYTPILGKVLTDENRQNYFIKLIRKLSSVVQSMSVTTFVKLSILEIKSRSDKKERINGYILNKKITEAVATAYKVTPIFVWQPVPAYKYDLNYHLIPEKDFIPISLSQKRDEFRYMAELVNKNKMGDNFLWCADLQKNIHESLYIDVGHYSAKMSRMLAETITKMLIEKNILKPIK